MLSSQVEWVQTARFKNFDLTDSVVLLKDMPPL